MRSELMQDKENKCGPGEIISDNGCKKCPIDTFQPMDHPNSSTGCQPCMNNDIFETGTTFTAYCPSGQLINAVFNNCIPCPIGMYKDNTLDRFSSECTPCPNGSATQNVGASHDSQCASHEEQNSLAVIIGTSVTGGLLLIVVVAFFIYRNRNKKLPEKGRSDMTDASNPMHVYDILHDGENNKPNSTDEYYVIPADVNISVTGDAQTSTGTYANESSIHVQNTDTTSSEKDVYTQLDVD
ncbi:hypothetical protein MAR_027974, partial [Mya arenaria]